MSNKNMNKIYHHSLLATQKMGYDVPLINPLLPEFFFS